MRFTLEFADSEVRDVTAHGDAVRVRFAAAAVHGEAGERGWLPGVVLTLAEATPDGDAAHAFGKLAGGRLRHEGRDITRPALPGALAGGIELALRFANGTQLSVHARSLALDVAADARFAEDLSC